MREVGVRGRAPPVGHPLSTPTYIYVDIPRAASNGVNKPQLIRFARVSSHSVDLDT